MKKNEGLTKSESHEWVLYVISDLERYFKHNGLSEISDELNGTHQVVSALLTARNSPQTKEKVSLRNRYTRFGLQRAN